MEQIKLPVTVAEKQTKLLEMIYAQQKIANHRLAAVATCLMLDTKHLPEVSKVLDDAASKISGQVSPLDRL